MSFDFINALAGLTGYGSGEMAGRNMAYQRQMAMNQFQMMQQYRQSEMARNLAMAQANGPNGYHADANNIRSQQNQGNLLTKLVPVAGGLGDAGAGLGNQVMGGLSHLLGGQGGGVPQAGQGDGSGMPADPGTTPAAPMANPIPMSPAQQLAKNRAAYMAGPQTDQANARTTLINGATTDKMTAQTGAVNNKALRDTLSALGTLSPDLQRKMVGTYNAGNPDAPQLGMPGMPIMAQKPMLGPTQPGQTLTPPPNGLTQQVGTVPAYAPNSLQQSQIDTRTAMQKALASGTSLKDAQTMEVGPNASNMRLFHNTMGAAATKNADTNATREADNLNLGLQRIGVSRDILTNRIFTASSPGMKQSLNAVASLAKTDGDLQNKIATVNQILTSGKELPTTQNPDGKDLVPAARTKYGQILTNLQNQWHTNGSLLDLATKRSGLKPFAGGGQTQGGFGGLQLGPNASMNGATSDLSGMLSDVGGMLSLSGKKGVVTSAVRSPQAGVTSSQHPGGRAADIGGMTQGDLEHLAAQARAHGYKALVEQPGQVTSNGARSTGLHLHLEPGARGSVSSGNTFRVK